MNAYSAGDYVHLQVQIKALNVFLSIRFETGGSLSDISGASVTFAGMCLFVACPIDGFCRPILID